jgi:hypothetical protein
MGKLMKVIIAHTTELDNKEAALNIISEQITEKLDKNTVGMMFCHYEFVLSGVAEHIAKNLPFPVIGASTTIAGYNIDERYKTSDDDQFRLVVLIMSSDDIEFTPVITGQITSDMSAGEICKDVFAGVGKQKIGITILPHIILTNPADLIDEVTKLTNAQLFGGTAVDDSPTYIEN